MNLYVCQCVGWAKGRMVVCSLNEGFVQFAPDVETMSFIFTFLAYGPYIFWIGRGVYNISGKCCGLVPFK